MCRKGSDLRKNGLTGTRGVCADGSKAHREKRPWIEELNRSCARLQGPPRGDWSRGADSGGSPQRRETVRCRRGRSRIEKAGAPSQWCTGGGPEKGPEAAKCLSQTKQEGMESRSTPESATGS